MLRYNKYFKRNIIRDKNLRPEKKYIYYYLIIQ